MVKNQSKRLSSSISILFISMALLIGTGTLFSQQAISQQDDTANSMGEIANQTEATTTNQSSSSIVTVNLTGLVNQTDGDLLGFRPINPIFCEENPDFSLCKEIPEPIPDNKCIRRPNLCNPCTDPTALSCPVPTEVEEFLVASTQQNLTSANASDVEVVPIQEVLQNVTVEVNNGNYTGAIAI